MSFVTAFQPGAFQANAFQIADIVPPVTEYRQPGGGYYRPVIYLDEEGRPVSLEERRRQREATDAEIDVPPVALSPEVLRALLAGVPGADPAQLLAMLDSAERRLLWADFDRQSAAEVAAQDDEALALLMLL